MEFWIEAVSMFLSSMFFWCVVFEVKASLASVVVPINHYVLVDEHRFLSISIVDVLSYEQNEYDAGIDEYRIIPRIVSHIAVYRFLRRRVSYKKFPSSD